MEAKRSLERKATHGRSMASMALALRSEDIYPPFEEATLKLIAIEASRKGNTKLLGILLDKDVSSVEFEANLKAARAKNHVSFVKRLNQYYAKAALDKLATLSTEATHEELLSIMGNSFNDELTLMLVQEYSTYLNSIDYYPTEYIRKEKDEYRNAVSKYLKDFHKQFTSKIDTRLAIAECIAAMRQAYEFFAKEEVDGKAVYENEYLNSAYQSHKERVEASFNELLTNAEKEYKSHARLPFSSRTKEGSAISYQDYHIMFTANLSVNSIVDEKDQTLLHHAVESESVNCIAFLVTIGADITKSNKNGKCPWQLAVRGENVRVLEALGGKDSSVMKEYISTIQLTIDSIEEKLRQISNHMASYFDKKATDNSDIAKERRDAGEVISGYITSMQCQLDLYKESYSYDVAVKIRDKTLSFGRDLKKINKERTTTLSSASTALRFLSPASEIYKPVIDIIAEIDKLVDKIMAVHAEIKKKYGDPKEIGLEKTYRDDERQLLVLNDLQSQLAKLVEINAKLEEKVRALAASCNELIKRNTTMARNVEELRAENASLKVELETKSTISTTKDCTDGTGATDSATPSRVAELEQELALIKKQLSATISENKTMSKELESARPILAALRAKAQPSKVAPSSALAIGGAGNSDKDMESVLRV